LPVALASHEKIVWNSSGWEDLPVSVQAFEKTAIKDYSLP
jgi:hypothetical protein